MSTRGPALINAFDWMLYVFGTVMVYTAIRLLRSGGESKHDIGNNRCLPFFAVA